MKKIIVFCIAAIATLAVSAVEPFVEVRQEFWGKRYCILTDVNGYTYKFNPPSVGSQIKLVTRTGWYIVDSSCVIVKYEDSGRK